MKSSVHSSGRLWSRARVALGAGVLALALAATACGGAANTKSAPAKGGWSDVVAAAKKEGSVQTYFTVSQQVLDQLNAAFTRKYGIKVNTYRAITPADLISRLENDKASGSPVADVVNYGDGVYLSKARSAGDVATDVSLPSAKGWPARYFKGGVAAFQVSVVTIVRNTHLVSAADAPKDWKDLLDPKWKGKIDAFEPRTGDLGYAYEFLKQKYGAGFVKKLDAQNPHFEVSGNQVASNVAAGQYPIGLSYTNITSITAMKGAPLAAVPTASSPAWTPYVYVSSYAPHPNAARLYLDFIMSAEGQRSYLGGKSGNSAISVPGSLTNPPGLTFMDPKTMNDDVPGFRSTFGLAS